MRTAIAGHAIGEAVEPRPFAEGKRQIPALYIMNLPGMDAALEWANKLPAYGCVEVRAGEAITEARARGLAELAVLRDAHQRLLA